MVFCVLTLWKGIKNNHRASKWLSLLLLLWAMYITPYMLGYAGWYSIGFTREFLFFFPFMQVLLIGPVVFFYTKSLLNPNFKLQKKDLLHFLPTIFYGIYTLIVFVVDKVILDEFYFYADGRDKDLSNWYQATGLISMVIYLILSLQYYFNYKNLIFDKVSYAETVLFQWIRNFMLAFLMLLLLRLLFFAINPNWGQFGSQFWYYITFSFIFYYIAITGYTNAIKQTTLFNKRQKIINVFEDEGLSKKMTSNPLVPESEKVHWKNKLTELMVKKQLFKNPQLTLKDVAEELETTTKMVSSIVNSIFKMNFNDFINHYRIEAIKNKLDNGEHNTSTLLGIALDCGFNSKATFNRAFKKSTSLSPKSYLDKISK